MKPSIPYRDRLAGGLVQQGLSAAGGALGFYQLGFAADKRCSLEGTGMPLLDFWAQLPPTEAVHPEDRQVLAMKAHAFRFSLPPGHIAGPLLSAPVVLCYGNPGFDEDDAAAAKDSQTWNRLAEQSSGTEVYPTWFRGWSNWLTERTKQLQLPAEALARTVAVFNIIPYASVDLSDADLRLASQLPSVAVARRYFHEVLVPRAKTGEIFLVVLRKHALWQVDGLEESTTFRLPRHLARGGALGVLGLEVRQWLDKRQPALQQQPRQNVGHNLIEPTG